MQFIRHLKRVDMHSLHQVKGVSRATITVVMKKPRIRDFVDSSDLVNHKAKHNEDLNSGDTAVNPDEVHLLN